MINTGQDCKAVRTSEFQSVLDALIEVRGRADGLKRRIANANERLYGPSSGCDVNKQPQPPKPVGMLHDAQETISEINSVLSSIDSEISRLEGFC